MQIFNAKPTNNRYFNTNGAASHTERTTIVTDVLDDFVNSDERMCGWLLHPARQQVLCHTCMLCHTCTCYGNTSFGCQTRSRKQTVPKSWSWRSLHTRPHTHFEASIHAVSLVLCGVASQKLARTISIRHGKLMSVGLAGGHQGLPSIPAHKLVSVLCLLARNRPLNAMPYGLCAGPLRDFLKRSPCGPDIVWADRAQSGKAKESLTDIEGSSNVDP